MDGESSRKGKEKKRERRWQAEKKLRRREKEIIK